MKKFFEKNRIFIAVIIAALIIGGAIYLGLNKTNKEDEIGGKEISECLAPSQAVVTKIIDGDTIVVEGGEHIRLLGIDADERGYSCYGEAKSRLEELVLNKEVRLEKDQTDVDQYNRCLRYVFLGKQNIDLQLVKEGLAIARSYEPDIKYKDEIALAEKEAMENKIGCKWSGSASLNGTLSDKNEKVNLQWEKLTTEKLGYDVVGACEAGQYLGRELIVEGKAVDTYRDSKSNTVFLNFEKPYPDSCFTGVIFSSNLYKFVQNPKGGRMRTRINLEAK